MPNTPTKMTGSDAGRIQGAEAKKNDGQVEKGGFAARAQAAAANNEAGGGAKGAGGQGGGKK